MRWIGVLWAVILAGAAWAQGREAQAIRVDGRILLDGRLDEAAWQAAPVQTGFVMLGESRAIIPPATQTAFRVVYDAETLYFGIRCEEPDMAHLHPYEIPGAWGAEMFAHDDVEIFLDPVGDRAQYYQFAVDPSGAQYMRYVQPGYAPVYVPDWRVGTYRGADYWSVEVAIPFAAFYLRPTATWQETWGFSMTRTRDAGHVPPNYRYSSYSPLQKGYHDAAHFGALGPIVHQRQAALLPALPRMRIASSPAGRLLWSAVEVTNCGDEEFTGTATLEGAAESVKLSLPAGQSQTVVWHRPLRPEETVTCARVRVARSTGHTVLQLRMDARAEIDLPCPGTPLANQLVNGWYLAGTAAGNKGDVYDNRDGGHSPFNLALFPQFTAITYSASERADEDRAGMGAARRVLPGVVIGNSSTAERKERLISHPFLFTTSQERMQLLYDQYRGNNLYVYPACADYAPGHNVQGGGSGDRFPTNAPYWLASEGYSGSDQPLLQASAYLLAALPPAVKTELAQHGMVMPTVQALFRAHRKGITARNYFTAAAHPPVFRGPEIDPVALVRAAHALTPATVPPLVLLKVVSEDKRTPGVDYLDPTREETLVDTPCVIARVHRRLARDMRLVISARDSVDLRYHALTFRWVVLRGQAKLTARKHGRECEIVIPWQGRLAASDDGYDANRVEIGVFASNGNAWSAPSFITVFYPDNERRAYDAAGRLLGIDYTAGDVRLGYATRQILPGSGYEITDWQGLLTRMLDDPGLPGPLLRGALSPARLAVLRRAAASLPDALAEHRHRLAVWENNPPAEKDAVTRSAEAAAAPLLLIDPAEGLSAKAIIEAQLNALLDDPRLVTEHLAALLPACNDAARTQLETQLDRLLRLGVLRRTPAGTIAVVDPLAPGVQREIGRLNAWLLGEVLCPGLLRITPTVNFVDRRLNCPAPWADTFHYNARGQCTGWTRLYADETAEFTGTGDKVMERDALGRPQTTRAVRYGVAVEYRDPQKKWQLVGRAVWSAQGVSVWDETGRQVIDADTAGRHAGQHDLRFVALDEEARYAVDLFRNDAQGHPLGFVRYQAGRACPYVKDGDQYVTFNADGQSQPASGIAYTIDSNTETLQELPTATRDHVAYPGDDDLIGQQSAAYDEAR